MNRVRNCHGCIQIIDTIERLDRYLIIMERPKNCRDLWEYIEMKGALNNDLAQFMFAQLIATVIQMKTKYGVLHRDLKDENILVDLDTHLIKLIDFGAGTYYTNKLLYDFEVFTSSSSSSSFFY
jgi:serine/threonine protein kinase